MAEVAVGAVVFSRAKKLQNLLESVESSPISSVYIADNGRVEQKKDIYENNHNINLTILDVEYDSGLAVSRREIVREMTEEYLLLVDSDMTIPNNPEVLLGQLEENQELGGVCGMIIEENRIYTSCSDIFISRNKCSKDIRNSKTIEMVSGHPFISFDQISNAALLRKACLDDYAWDPEYKIGREHLDFYLHHKLNTHWKFGLCPSVYFPHYPGGSNEYQNIRSRTRHSEEYFKNKWGFESVDTNYTNYIDTYNPDFGGFPPYSDLKKAAVYLESGGPDKLLSKIKSRLKSGDGAIPSIYQRIIENK